ncbi:MAG: large conductance mechanosensitive channel protein MscL [Ancrocorticia sp.]|uniref:large conductance mechanosensitive channel protein MscL n=1 Tax=Ancrocorticia sp. TaxID=2593684 RepID=UPI003F918442
MLRGFRDFIMRGNVIDLAVGIIIGAAFTPIIDAITTVIMDVIAALVGKPNFDNIWTITLNGTDILPGAILTALVNFLFVAAALYFFVVMPMNRYAERKKAAEEEAPEPDTNELLGEIRDLLAASKKE